MRNDITNTELGALLKQLGFAESAAADGSVLKFDHPSGCQILLVGGKDVVLPPSAIFGSRYQLDAWGILTADQFDQKFDSKKVG